MMIQQALIDSTFLETHQLFYLVVYQQNINYYVQLTNDCSYIKVRRVSQIWAYRVLL